MQKKEFEDKNRDGVDDQIEEKEKKSAIIEQGKKYEKAQAKKLKHTTKQKTPAQKRIDDEPFSLHKG